MHEQIARSMYYCSIHLLYASIVGILAWLLTSFRVASATTKYWIWVVAAFNFVVPSGALIDKLWATHLTWARPLGAIGGPIWDMTEGRTAVVLAAIWVSGTSFMLLRLILRLRNESRELRPTAINDPEVISNIAAIGYPVSFGDEDQGPAVLGIFFPHILLPIGIGKLLTQRELSAILLHEVEHARRRDNLIRVLYELSFCVLWFHPVLWLAGARMAFYRELSCDESVLRHAHGEALLSALAKLALPEQARVLEASASSHVSYRLLNLARSTQTTNRAASFILSSLFATALSVGTFQTIAHTACCFVLKR